MLRFDNPVFWSIPLGRWRGVPLRMSLLCPGALIPACYHFGIATGLLYGSAFFGMVVLHELARLSILTQEPTGRQNPMIIWPFGNLASDVGTVPAPKGFAECFLGMFSLFFCLLVGLATVSGVGTPSWVVLFNELPALSATAPINSAGLIILAVATKLLVINSLPIRTMDMGRFLEYYLQGKWDEQDKREISLKISLITGFLTVVVACISQTWWVVPAAFVLIAVTIGELSQRVESLDEEQDDTFLGYDFSAGYTSLENSTAEVLHEPSQPVGMIGRWMARGEERRRVQEEEMARLIETELDRILSKVHEVGVNGLTARERQILNQASLQYRNRGKASSM